MTDYTNLIARLEERGGRIPTEAAAAIRELGAQKRELALDVLAASGQAQDAYEAQLEAEAKLVECEARLGKAVDALKRLVSLNEDYSPFGGELFQDRVERTWQKARTTLAEIEGEKG